MELRAGKAKRKMFFVVSEKLLIFLPKAKFQENIAMLFIFSNNFLPLGPVVVFFAYLVPLSSSSCLYNPAGVLQSVRHYFWKVSL